MNKHLRLAPLAALFAAAVVWYAAPAWAEPAPTFDAARLEQLVAPIALYPDSLLTQVLMASTYPLEVVEAARWVQKNPGLSSAALDEALKDASWDPSVKSLCALPDVLSRMNENLQWTQDLGDAFLAQEADLLAAVQRMRNIAYEAGTLRTTEQQKVIVQDRVVVIQPAAPQVIYVPVYSPAVVYGPTWGYSSYYYPSFYAAPPPGYALFSFGVGVAIGAALWGDCDWGYWGGHGYYGGRGVYINYHHYNHYNRHTNHHWHDRHGDHDGGRWHHDPGHRRGVTYRNPETAHRFGAAPGSTRVTREQARDFSDTNRAGGGARRDIAPGKGTADRDRDRDRAKDGGSRREMAPRLGKPTGSRDSGGAPAPRVAPRPGMTDGGGRVPSSDFGPRHATPGQRIDSGAPTDSGARPPSGYSSPRSSGAPSGQRSPGAARPPSGDGSGGGRSPSGYAAPRSSGTPSGQRSPGAARPPSSGSRGVKPPSTYSAPRSSGAPSGQRSPTVQRPPSGGGGGSAPRGGAAPAPEGVPQGDSRRAPLVQPGSRP